MAGGLLKKALFVFLFVALALGGAFSFVWWNHRGGDPSTALARGVGDRAAAPVPAKPLAPQKRDLLNTEFRGIYITSWTAGIRRFQELLQMLEGSELNAVVIDVKDSTGRVGYDSKLPAVAELGSHEKRIRDLDGVLRACKEKGIHTIARIAVFEDPALAKARPDLAIRDRAGGIWKDRKGLSWVDPASPFVWDYNLDIAKEVAARGFEEVQFDYVRFPTDGRLKALTYPVYKGDEPKHEVITRFFQYLDRGLKPVDVLVSADVFGLTVLAEDDLNIGQRIEDIAPYVDFICPMVYPSHYPPGHLGLKKPAEHPYRVVYDSCVRGLDRIQGKRARIRPWLQDFKLGAAYDRTMILDQIQAVRDAGTFGFCMWNARNVYTAAAYAGKLPVPNPHPPLYDSLRAALDRRRQAQDAKDAGPKPPEPKRAQAKQPT